MGDYDDDDDDDDDDINYKRQLNFMKQTNEIIDVALLKGNISATLAKGR